MVKVRGWNSNGKTVKLKLPKFNQHWKFVKLQCFDCLQLAMDWELLSCRENESGLVCSPNVWQIIANKKALLAWQRVWPRCLFFFFFTQVQTPVTLSSGEWWSILVWTGARICMWLFWVQNCDQSWKSSWGYWMLRRTFCLCKRKAL